MRPLHAHISRTALAHNLAVARRHAGAARVFAVVKANAYGHGLARAAAAFAAADGYAVLTLDDAAVLRRQDARKPVLLLEGAFAAAEIEACAEFGLTPVLHHESQLAYWRERPPSAPLPVFVKFDSGMHRLGFPLAGHAATLAAVRALPNVGAITLMTHFSQADEAAGVDWQLTPFREALAATGLPWSSANSAALLRHPQSGGDWVRPGLMLYGASPFADAPAASLGLVPAMSFESALISVQRVRAGEGVGYGQLWRAEREQSVGIVACGYADGYPRHAPTGTPVLVDGVRTRTLGRVSMDMLCVDLAGVPQARLGSRVVLWGEGLPVEEVAAAAGTVSYELLCALAPRVPVADAI